MKRDKGFLNRMSLTAFAVLSQMFWMAVFILQLSEYYMFANIALVVLSLFVVVYIINGRSNPAVKLAWIVPIMIFPLFGGLAYLFFGTKKPMKKITKAINTQEEKTKSLIPGCKGLLNDIKAEDIHIYSQLEYINRMGFPVYKDTAVKYFTLGENYYESLLEDIKEAKEFIFMEYFIIGEGKFWSSIFDVLKAKAQKGVEVRVMYDDVGCINTLPSDFKSKLKSAGIKCVSFNPFVPVLSIVANNRDHRKITVIDGNIAYTGGINIADEYINEKERFGHWKDTGVRLEGKAVWGFTHMFLNIWNAFDKADEDISVFMPKVKAESDGYVVPYGDSPLDNEIFAENVYINIINNAVDYVYIFTPYLIIDTQTITSITLAAKRGVDIRIMVPGIPDKRQAYELARSHYPELIENGVKIYEYTPGFVHAKSFVADDNIAVVGTINLDYRSLYHHFECGCIFYKSDIIKEIKRDFLSTAEKSELVEDPKTKYKITGVIQGIYYAFLRLFAPLL